MRYLQVSGAATQRGEEVGTFLLSRPSPFGSGLSFSITGGPQPTPLCPPRYPARPVCTILFSSGLSVFLFIFTVRQNVDTTAYLFARDGVFLQNAYWLLTYPDTDTTAARTCLTEGSSTAAVIVIKEVDGYVLEPVSVRSLTPPLANKGVAVFTSCRTAN